MLLLQMAAKLEAEAKGDKRIAELRTENETRIATAQKKLETFREEIKRTASWSAEKASRFATLENAPNFCEFWELVADWADWIENSE